MGLFTSSIGLVPRAMRDLWFDGLYTFYIARPSIATIWSALLHGVDFNPPLIYLFTRASQTVFGIGPVAARLPAMIGFTVTLLCVFTFMVRRHHASFAFVAALFPLLNRGVRIRAMARAYGLFLGFAGPALIAWQGAADGHRLLLESSITGHRPDGRDVDSLLWSIDFPAVRSGKAVRDYRRRRIDWGARQQLGSRCQQPLFTCRCSEPGGCTPVNRPIFRPELLSIPKFHAFLLGRQPLL